MSEELKDMFNSSAHLTQNEMLDYLAGRLHGDRLRKAELHIADCELCTDALEGLSLLTTEEQQSSLAKLENKITERVKEKPVLVILFRRAIAIAAILLLVIGGAFYLNEFISKKQSQVAENLSEKKSELEKSVDSIHLKNDSIYDEKTIKFTPPVGNGKPIEDVKEPDNQPVGGFVFKNVPKEENQTAQTITMDDAPAPPTVESKISEPDTYNDGDAEKIINRNENDATTITVNPSVTTSGTVTQQMSSPNNSYSYSSPQQLSDVEIISTKKNKSGKDKDLYEESKNMEQPNVFTDSVTVDMPSDMFNLAMQYKAAGEKQRAIDKLDELIKLNNNFKPQAMWEKALLLIELNKKDKAKTVLTDLSKIESTYKQQAIDKLKEL